MSRDSYTAPVTCPECNQKGILHLSEEGSVAYLRNRSVEVEGIEGKFKAVGQSSGAISVVCLMCKKAFDMKP
jgi:hypothetical protein